MEEKCLSPEVGGTILPDSRQYRPFGALNVILMRSWGVAPGFHMIDPSGLSRMVARIICCPVSGDDPRSTEASSAGATGQKDEQK